jgi:type IV pilus assembly protein PilV
MITAHRTRRVRLSPQRGSFLLEALVAILIVALGILGTVGLYARSVQNVDDSKFRGEAALLANGVVGAMWTSDPKTLVANFDSGSAGPGYTEFAALVAQRLPNSKAPVVTVTFPGSTPTSSNVLITIQWKHPGDAASAPYREFDLNATIGMNP